MQSCSQTGLPVGDASPALALPHFPARFQAVIWRNWELVTAERLATVLETSVSTLSAEAHAMGLGVAAAADCEKRWLRRGYITLIRQNWHLLPYPQLLTLLGWTPEQMRFALKEDDFLWNKLGNFKPQTPPVHWRPLTPAEQRATAALRGRVDSVAAHRALPLDPPFAFLSRYGRQPKPIKRATTAGDFGLKLVYAYSAVYGDPLLDPDCDPYPDGLLADLAANGVNAVWLQGVLYTLVPWLGNASGSAGQAQRLANLKRLIAKTAGHGIGLYLYLNEPRGMPPAFFDDAPGAKGAYFSGLDQHAICVSAPGVLDRLRDGVAELFRQAPGLAGVFTITMSENLTHCRSKSFEGAGTDCPRCGARSTAEWVAATNNAIAEGAHAVKPEADVIAWNWSWEAEWSNAAIDLLRPDIQLMCTSESFLPTRSGGVDGLVGDYTMSRVGPGPVATQCWSHAVARGLKVLAKVQMNNTWECSAVPYLPVPFLVKAHLRNLKAHGVSGLMAAWTLGGYPGGNLRLAEETPEALALDLFAKAAAPEILSAWQRFGEAFAEFPLHACFCLYTGPQNYGPMNLLFARPSGFRGTMLGFPYDDLDAWSGSRFTGELFENQFRRLSEGWAEGLSLLAGAAGLVPAERWDAYDDLCRVAEAAYCHFRSTYLQARFIRLRDAEAPVKDVNTAVHAVLDEEIDLVQRLLTVMRRDSRIGFEASNHYYYTERSLMEKVLNCEQVRAAFPLADTPTS